MKRAHSLRTKFTLTIALAILLTVAAVTLLSNVVINRQFVKYISQQQQEKTVELASSLSQQYYGMTGSWDVNFIHTIGMNALYDGYIINVLNLDGQSVWDAQNHDMTMCAQVMSDIKARMEKKYPAVDGEFVSEVYPLAQHGMRVGSVEISYFGPFFLSENDFNFLQMLNTVLLGVGAVSLLLSVLAGSWLAGRLSRPILKTAEASERMAGGDYRTRIHDTPGTRELGQLIGSINHLASTLERQEHLRKQLTADVAHELRTPLHTVGIQLESMIEGVWEPTTDRLQSCHEEVRRIGGLVKDLENLARVESDNLRLETRRVDYWELIHKSLESLEIEIIGKQLHIETAGKPLSICVDPARWRQVVHNLLTNAIKYTPAGGIVRITVEQDSGWAVLGVEDNGIGIPESDLPHVFERFYRADKSRNRTTGGAGIGLAVVKSIVTAHGGRVEVESRDGEGSLFQVSIPLCVE